MKKQIDKYNKNSGKHCKRLKQVWIYRILIGTIILIILMLPEILFSQDEMPQKSQEQSSKMLQSCSLTLPVSFLQSTISIEDIKSDMAYAPCYSVIAFSYFQRWNLQNDDYQINNECEAYRDQVESIAAEYDMSEYVDLILAVMMQESSGRGADVMQASEGEFNLKFPREPDGITNASYSIVCGIQELKRALDESGVTGPYDLQNIEQALQAYNFGIYYLDFAREKGTDCWQEETVAAYAKMASGGKTRNDIDSELMGKWRYGDQLYPQHVLRYYPPYAKQLTKETSNF